MKSPLIDALRQAKGLSDSPEHELSDGDVSSEEMVGFLPAANEPELQLLDDGADDAGDRDLHAEFPGHPAGDTGVTETSGAANLEDDESFADIVSDARQKNLQTTKTQSAPGANMSVRSGPLCRVATWSPLICILLFGASAGAYFTVQHMLDTDAGLEAYLLPDRHDAATSAGPHADPTKLSPFRHALAVPVPEKSADEVLPPIAGSDADHTGQAQSTAGDQSAATVPSKSQELTTNDQHLFGIVMSAYMKFRNGDYRGAESGYRSALQIAPYHIAALEGLAATLRRLGREEEALQYYENVLSVDPENIDAAAALVSIDSSLSPEEARIAVKELIQRRPDSAGLRFLLGMIHSRAGQWPEARRMFGEARQLDSTNAEYAYNLAVSQERLGHYDEARVNYELALQLAGADSGLDPSEIQVRLSSLVEHHGASR